MRTVKNWNVLLIAVVAIAAVSAPAVAKPLKNRKQPAEVVAAASGGPGSMPIYTATGENKAGASTAKAPSRRARQNVEETAANTAPFIGSSDLVAEARRYIGGNPTGRGSLWCGAFMDMVLKKTGHAGGGNLASGYARYGRRISGPQVGAIAVMGRKGGGHVGVVSGIDPSGNPIIISGNHNRVVAETVYPRGRIYAYVVPE